MKKHLVATFIALALVAGALGFVPVQTPAATNQTQQPFSVSAAGQDSPIIPLNGYSSCSVQVDNAGTGMTLTAQSTSDANPTVGSQWATVTTIGTSGSITAFGIYTGNVAGVGLTGFKFHVTALTTGPVTGSISCSTATAGGGAVVISSLPPIAISPLPLPVAVASSVPIVISSLPPITCGTGCATPIPFPTLGVNVLNTPGVNCGNCATPIPYPTSSPGNALIVVPANPSAQPYTAALPEPMQCISGCSGGATVYSTCKITTTAATVCKASAATLVGFFNDSASAQTGTITCYDNATTNSGTVVATIAPLGATQIITWPAPGRTATTNGLTCIDTVAPGVTAVEVYYF